MFCSNCGNKLEDDSVFCTSCGMKQNATTQTTEVKLNISKESNTQILKGVFNSIKNPTESVSILRDTVSSLHTKLLFFITLLIIPLIHISTIKSTISNFIVSLAEFVSKIEGQAVSSLELSAAKSMINMALSEVIPYGTIFTYGLVFLFLLFGFILGLMFLFFKLNKETLAFDDAIRALTLPALTLLVSSLISPFILSFGFIISIIISLTFAYIFAITIYTGFKSLGVKRNLLPYVTGFTVAFAYSLSYYIQFKMIFSEIMSSAMQSPYL